MLATTNVSGKYSFCPSQYHSQT